MKVLINLFLWKYIQSNFQSLKDKEHNNHSFQTIADKISVVNIKELSLMSQLHPMKEIPHTSQ